MRKIFGLTGRLGSGKSEAAKMLHAWGFTVVKFAGPLKHMMRCLGLTDAHIEGHLKEVPCDILCGKTPRFAMQSIGTEWGRQTIGDSLWINAWKYRIDSYPPYVPMVADDVRFDNEVEAIRSVKGTLIRIERSPQFSPVKPGQPIIHASEIMDFPVDVTIENNGTLDELREKLYALL